MKLSIFTDELGMDVTKAVPIIRDWGLDTVDLRGRVFGKAIEALTEKELRELRKLLSDHGMRVGCIESSLAKVHLPDDDRIRAEADKLEGIIRAVAVLDCRLVRSFFFWQPPAESRGAFAVRPDEQQKVLDRFMPLAERAKNAGLILAFENCGVTHDEVIAMLEACDVPSWGMAWDVCNTWDCDERKKDHAAFIRRLAPYARLVHVKAKGALKGTAPFTIPYEEVLQVCDSAGLQGPVSVETHNADPTVKNQEASKQVVDVIRGAWPSAAPGSLTPAAGAKAVSRPWEDDPVRFAVIGLGMGHSRSKQITETNGAKLVGVCDLVEERAKRTAEACGVPWSTDMRRWLEDDEVEVVYVMTETGRHGEVAEQALAAGKHVITTKPMEANLDACDSMIRKAAECDRLLAVDFGRRFQTDLHTLRAAVSEGWFGRLLSASFELKILRNMEYFRRNGGWRGTRRWDGGGVLSNQSVHHIDEFAFALGIPARVQCTIRTQSHDIEAEDYGAALWEYDDGTMVCFTGTTSYPHKTWFDRLEITGEQGAYFRVEGGPFGKPVERWFLDGAWSEDAPETVKPAWLNAADNMAAAIREGQPLTCSGRDGRRTQAILDAMYRSAYDEEGGWADVAPDLD